MKALHLFEYYSMKFALLLILAVFSAGCSALSDFHLKGDVKLEQCERGEDCEKEAED